MPHAVCMLASCMLCHTMLPLSCSARAMCSCYATPLMQCSCYVFMLCYPSHAVLMLCVHAMLPLSCSAHAMCACYVFMLCVHAMCSCYIVMLCVRAIYVSLSCSVQCPISKLNWTDYSHGCKKRTTSCPLVGGVAPSSTPTSPSTLTSLHSGRY